MLIFSLFLWSIPFGKKEQVFAAFETKEVSLEVAQKTCFSLVSYEHTSTIVLLPLKYVASYSHSRDVDCNNLLGVNWSEVFCLMTYIDPVTVRMHSCERFGHRALLMV